jgi:hypothetical protein
MLEILYLAINTKQIRRILEVIAIAGGVEEADAILAGSPGNWITTLVTAAGVPRKALRVVRGPNLPAFKTSKSQYGKITKDTKTEKISRKDPARNASRSDAGVAQRFGLSEPQMDADLCR